ncbi:hypothetical protein WT83_29025 [Burkholderia territorii]|uniref:DUF692 domain-containing protein n=1 Tax=Burkholderia territorii TaxID=1503055 RepID=A0A108E6J2_9BURK|nr:DUF692 domain-containing protein [Burkholderia territorii]KWN05606.1 hypothetical protein WT83_29025 [Burkholderia territorii]
MIAFDVPSSRTASSIRGAGLGLRSSHVADVLVHAPDVGWWEVHSENYFGGGEPVAVLQRIRERYPISLHGVGMGLGNADGLDSRHLAQTRALIERIEPGLVSEHLCWNRANGRVFHDLLPVPRIKGAIDIITANVCHAQDALGRRIAIENVSTYVAFRDEVATEMELLTELTMRTGCSVLLDLNNLHVNTLNLGIDPFAELARLPADCVEEIHVAGFEWLDDIAIDTHGTPVSEPVWTLLNFAVARFGDVPVLLERDTHLPPLDVLLNEYHQLETRLR